MEMEWFGVGKETAPSTTTAPPVFFPFIAHGEEQCERCGAIKPRAYMSPIGCDENGEPLYECNGD